MTVLFPHPMASSTGAACLLLALVVALAGCSRPAPVEEPLRAVKVQAVGASGIETTPEYSAEVRARIESQLGFRVAGKILRRQADVAFKVGQAFGVVQLACAQAGVPIHAYGPMQAQVRQAGVNAQHPHRRGPFSAVMRGV